MRATGVVVRGLLTLALTAAFGCSRPVTYVDRVVIVNPTPYDVNVVVGPGDRSAWLAVGTARHDAETPFEEVVDQGETWVVRFAYGGEVGGEVSVRRAELARNGWRITVPPDVAERLRGRSVVPPP
jgi:hypothetical protein